MLDITFLIDVQHQLNYTLELCTGEFFITIRMRDICKGDPLRRFTDNARKTRPAEHAASTKPLPQTAVFILTSKIKRIVKMSKCALIPARIQFKSIFNLHVNTQRLVVRVIVDERVFVFTLKETAARAIAGVVPVGDTGA